MKTRILVEVTDNLLLETIERYQEAKNDGCSDNIALQEGLHILEQRLNREFREQRAQVLISFTETMQLLHSQKDTVKV